jgi:hypothetical protein
MKRFALLALLVIVLFSVIAPAALAQDGNPVQAAAQQYFQRRHQKYQGCRPLRQPERW